MFENWNYDFETLQKRRLYKKKVKIFILKFGGLNSFSLLCSAKPRKTTSYAPKKASRNREDER